MKKNYLKLMVLLCAAILCVGFVSCGDDKDDSSDPQTPITPEEPSTDKAMTSVEQKEHLEQVALEFMNMMPSSDFREIADLGRFINENYIKDYDWGRVENWAKDAFKATRQVIKTSTDEEEYWGSKYEYIYTDYKALLLASNFTGHFTARNGRWVQEEANDLQFIFTDQQGKQCVLKLETGGSVKNVHLWDDEDWDYDYEYIDGSYMSKYFIDNTQYTIGVPEKIIVTLTQGGDKVVKATINIDLGSINGEEFNINKNSINLSALVELNNGYKFNVSNVTYTANTKASVAFTMSKNGTALVTIGVSADVYDIPSVNVSAFSAKDYDPDDYDFEDVNAKNAFVKLDILGKIQLQGKLSDVRKFVDYLNEADDNRSDEKTFKSYINQANSLADVNLFYDGKNLKQAAIKLEPFVDESWYGHIYWKAEPVIYFYDGTSYSTFEAFFNKKDFKKTIDTFKALADKYADLLEERIYW